MNKPSVIIAGAGWAGLAAAVELSRHNIPVTLVESARQIGGRARRVEFDGLNLDNGQHLMIGAYDQLLALLELIDVNEYQVFHRLPHQIDMRDINTGQSQFQLKLPRLPAPLHLLVGMLRSPSLSLKQKITSLFRFNRLIHAPIDQDISVDHWLAGAGLPEAYVESLLKPLCLAALTTPTAQASARIFQSVLQQTFNGPAANTDLLIPRTDLGDLFPDAARSYIESCGGQLLTEHKLEQIQLENEQIRSVTIAGKNHSCDELILATPAHTTTKLLHPLTSCSSIVQALDQLSYEPITTIYLQYPSSAKLDLPMLGLLNGLGEWIFDRRYCGQPGLMAVVISAHGTHMALQPSELADRISTELAQVFPQWPEPGSHRVIREKRACIRSHIDVDNLRPAINTPIPNLNLCGDYLKTEPPSQAGLPSTLEGALRSGVECALGLVQKLA